MIGVEALGIRKYFPANGVEALSDASFDLRPGEIHALVGENGAGKSTLMHILAGLVEPSSGTILVNSKERRFADPEAALKAGLGLVRQHPQTVPGFTLWEDCVLGAEPTRRGILRRAAARKTVRDLSCRWGFDLDPDARTNSLTVSQRQKAAVLALLMRGVRFLLLDEPTAVLAPQETERLFDLLRALKADGVGIALISHKLPETLGIADRITVLRRGAVAGTVSTAGTDAEALRGMMFGHSKKNAGVSTGPDGSPGERALRISGLRAGGDGFPLLRGIELELRRGEILGAAGVRESGLGTLELAVSGMLRPHAGSIQLFGADIGGKGPRAFRDAGGVYVPADRMGIALGPRLSLGDNLTIHARSRGGRRLSGLELKARVRAILETARVSGDPRDPASSFSGGTLQRLILSREFAENPEFLLLSEPGWGLDAASKADLDQRIRRLAASGKAILLLSTDLDELTALCGSVVVLRDGRVSDRFDRSEFSDPDELREALGAAMIGTEACVDR